MFLVAEIEKNDGYLLFKYCMYWGSHWLQQVKYMSKNGIEPGARYMDTVRPSGLGENLAGRSCKGLYTLKLDVKYISVIEQQTVQNYKKINKQNLLKLLLLSVLCAAIPLHGLHVLQTRGFRAFGGKWC